MFAQNRNLKKSKTCEIINDYLTLIVYHLTLSGLPINSEARLYIIVMICHHEAGRHKEYTGFVIHVSTLFRRYFDITSTLFRRYSDAISADFDATVDGTN